MNIYKYFLLIFIFAAPLVANANTPSHINITNNALYNSDSGLSSGDYPRVTAHIDGGSFCWNDYGLADWNQSAKPNGGNVSIYSESNNENDPCRGGYRQAEAAVRGFSLFMQYSPNQSWVRISQIYWLKEYINQINFDSIFLWQGKNIPSGAWLEQPAACGLDIRVRVENFPGTAFFEVSGNPTPNCGVSTSFTSTKEASDPAESLSIIPVNMTLGQKKTIKLRGLDSGSVWILGECTGDAVLEDDVVHHHTLKKVLPSTVTVKATGRGTESCDVVGVHYPENSPVVTLRYVFTVK